MKNKRRAIVPPNPDTHVLTSNNSNTIEKWQFVQVNEKGTSIPSTLEEIQIDPVDNHVQPQQKSATLPPNSLHSEPSDEYEMPKQGKVKYRRKTDREHPSDQRYSDQSDKRRSLLSDTQVDTIKSTKRKENLRSFLQPDYSSEDNGDDDTLLDYHNFPSTSTHRFSSFPRQPFATRSAGGTRSSYSPSDGRTVHSEPIRNTLSHLGIGFDTPITVVAESRSLRSAITATASQSRTALLLNNQPTILLHARGITEPPDDGRSSRPQGQPNKNEYANAEILNVDIPTADYDTKEPGICAQICNLCHYMCTCKCCRKSPKKPAVHQTISPTSPVVYRRKNDKPIKKQPTYQFPSPRTKNDYGAIKSAERLSLVPD